MTVAPAESVPPAAQSTTVTAPVPPAHSWSRAQILTVSSTIRNGDEVTEDQADLLAMIVADPLNPHQTDAYTYGPLGIELSRCTKDEAGMRAAVAAFLARHPEIV